MSGLRTAVLVLAVGALVAAPGPGQPLLRTLYVTVTDAAGTPVTDLAAEDFTVREAGHKREVVGIERATDPVSIALLVDDSQASDPYLHDVRDGLLAFVRKLYVRHELALIGYGDRPTIHADYTHDLVRLTNAVRRLYAHPQAGSYLLDALVQASDGLRKREAAHGAIVIVDASGVEFSNRLHDDVIAAVKRGGAVVYVLQLDGGLGANELEPSRIETKASLEGSAQATGGVNRYLLTSLGVSKPLLQIAQELQSRYRLVYESGSRYRAAEVAVGVGRAGLKARATPAVAASASPRQ